MASSGATPLREVSRAELSLHNSPGDLWIAIGESVYDISIVPSFHPGGEKILTYRAGRQVQDVFKAVHGDSYEVDSVLEQLLIGRLGAPNQTVSPQWEQVLDKIVEAQNDLTNHSRFEQRPTGLSAQLSQAPPADSIRNALDCFGRAWACLLKGIAPMTGFDGDSLARRLQQALEGAALRFDKRLAGMYSEVCESPAHCAAALREVFDIHEEAIVEIHNAVDRAKRRLASSIDAGYTPEGNILEDATKAISMAIEGMLR